MLTTIKLSILAILIVATFIIGADSLSLGTISTLITLLYVATVFF